MISLVMGNVLMLPVFVIPGHAQKFPITYPSDSTNHSRLFNLGMANQTGGSLVESFGSPQALVEAVRGEAQKPKKVDRMVEKFGLFETDKTLEEGKEQVKCTNRMMAGENE